MCFFPIVVSFCDGLGEMDQGYLNLVKTYGGSKWQIYRIVKIPAAMISLLSGLKVAATYSISGAVVGEWIASQSGLGYYLIRAKNGYMLDKVICLRADDCHFEPVDERGSEAVRVCSAAITQEAQKTNMTSGRVFIA